MKTVAALGMERKDIKEINQQILKWEWGGTLNLGGSMDEDTSNHG